MNNPIEGAEIVAFACQLDKDGMTGDGQETMVAEGEAGAAEALGRFLLERLADCESQDDWPPTLDVTLYVSDQWWAARNT